MIALLADDSFSFSTCWRYFNHAGNLLLRASSRDVIPFPHIRVIFLLIEAHSAATAFSQGGKWQVKISRHLSPAHLPPLAKVA